MDSKLEKAQLLHTNRTPQLQPAPWEAPILLGALLAAILIGSLPLLGFSPLYGGVAAVAVTLVLLAVRLPLVALYLTIFVALLPPGLIPPLLYSQIFLALLALSLSAWLVQMMVQRRAVVVTVPVLLFALFWLWALITVLWAADPILSRQRLVQYLLVITLLFLIVNQVNSRRRLNGLLATLALNGWVLVASGGWTLLVTGYEPDGRLRIFELNENMMGTLLILATAGVVWQAWRAPARLKVGLTWLSILFVVAALGLIVLSGSRGGLIAFALLLLAFGMARRTRIWAIGGATVALIALIIAPLLVAPVIERFTDPVEGELGGRDVLWRAGLLYISDHPLAGAGIGNGTYALPPYIRAISSEDHLHRRVEMPAHNPLIEVGVDTGLLGLLLYGAALVSAGWLFLRSFLAAYQRRSAYWLGYSWLVAAISVAFLFTWIKSGGVDAHVSTFLMVALWLAPYRVGIAAQQREAVMMVQAE
jgi:putative inorganic carbon (hco3(-)) transporter